MPRYPSLKLQYGKRLVRGFDAQPPKFVEPRWQPQPGRRMNHIRAEREDHETSESFPKLGDIDVTADDVA